MTIPDHIHDSVDAAVDQPVDGLELLRQVRARKLRSPLVAPLAAAAAVALVAVGTTVAIQRDAHLAKGQPAGGADVVPFRQQQPGDGDVPAPQLQSHSGPPPIMCGRDMVTAALGWQAHGDVLTGSIRISLKKSDPPLAGCELEGGDPVLTLLGPADGQVGPDSTYTGVPDAPLPPAQPRRYVDEDKSVVIPATLTGSNCILSNWAGLSGIAPDLLLQFNFDTGTLPCDKSRPAADGTLTLGLPHTQGQPGAALPADRKLLKVSLELPDQVREHQPLRFRVHLANPTGKDIALHPCPAYEATYSRVDSGGTTFFTNSGRLNCDAAPAAVPAGGDVVFEMVQSDLQSDQPGTKDAPVLSVQWGIAGPPAAVADVAFVRASTTSAPQGSPTLAELFAEVGAYPGKPWQKDGVDVTPQELVLVQGPSHCQWERALFLGGTGLPADGHGVREWTRDPEGVLTHFPRSQQEFQAHAVLPSDAAATGYTQGDIELWLAPSDEGQYAYLVNARDRSDVERWVRGGGGCA